MKSVQESDDLLIDLIYSAMLGETSWQHFLEQMSQSSPGSWSVLFSHGGTRGNGFVGLHTGCDQNAIDAYDNYYSTVNPWAPYCALKKPGAGIIGHDAYPHAELVRSEYYNDFLLELGVRSSAGCTIDKGHERTFLISSMTVDDDPELIRPIADQFTRLAPHLKRAADFYRRESAIRAVSELGGSLFDAVNIGMVMIGEGGRLKAWSEAAQNIVEETAALRMSPLGRILLKHETAQAVMTAMLARDYDGPKLLSFADEAVKTTLVHVKKDRLSYYFEGPTVILLLERPGLRDATELDSFAAAHSLTKSEVRALEGMIAGKSTSEIASANGLSRETIRSQVKSLYSRLDVRSEAELLRLFYAGARGRSAKS